jgi:hypothetical protein
MAGEHDWSKPAAMAIPEEGYFELKRGRYPAPPNSIHKAP